LFTVRLRTNQVITGTALAMLSSGGTGAAYRMLYGSGGAALRVPTSGPLEIPLLSGLPLLGPAFFMQPPITYLLYALVPGLWIWLNRTHSGLALRALGEAPAAVEAAGIQIDRMRVAMI